MNILVLGGGAQGRVIATDLATRLPQARITVADVRDPKLQPLPNLSWREADCSASRDRRAPDGRARLRGGGAALALRLRRHEGRDRGEAEPGGRLLLRRGRARPRRRGARRGRDHRPRRGAGAGHLEPGRRRGVRAARRPAGAGHHGGRRGAGPLAALRLLRDLVARRPDRGVRAPRAHRAGRAAGGRAGLQRHGARAGRGRGRAGGLLQRRPALAHGHAAGGAPRWGRRRCAGRATPRR